MKKPIAVILLLVVTVTDTFAQTMSGLGVVSPSTFATWYGFKNGRVTPDTDNEYYWKLDLADDVKFGAYEGEDYAVDTAKEWFLAMACGTSQIKVTDVSMSRKIEAVLPSNDKKKRGLQAGLFVYQDLVVAGFLGNADMQKQSRAMLEIIRVNNGVTRADVEAYYRQNIAAYVASLVNEQVIELKNANLILNVSAARLAEVKRAITDFMLTPCSESYKELLLTYRRNTGDASMVLGYTMEQINSEVHNALSEYRVLAGAAN